MKSILVSFPGAQKKSVRSGRDLLSETFSENMHAAPKGGGGGGGGGVHCIHC